MLASRLSERADTRVLLVEAGGDKENLLVRMPAAVAYAMRSRRYNWGYASEPEPYLSGRSIDHPRGKGLGGSSLINGMVYLRGHPADFDGWAARGARGWDWASVAPYFRKLEGYVSSADEENGTEGPLRITRPKLCNPLTRAFVKAGGQAGYAVTDGFNGTAREGFGPFDGTYSDGLRMSTSRAYLTPEVRRRPNLKIATHASVERINFRDRKATGLTYRHRGTSVQCLARREVIICLGAFDSPKLLMLSGIGPAPQLAALDIPVRHDNRNVGQNLADHLEVYLQVESLEPVSLYGETRPARMLGAGLQWLLNGSGICSSNHWEAGALIRSKEDVPYPDIEFEFIPLAVQSGGREFGDRHGFQINLGPSRPEGRGRMWLASADPARPAQFQFGYLELESDRRVMRDAMRIARKVVAQPAFDRFRGAELRPGRDVSSDDEIDAFVRESAGTVFHPCGTCRMGDEPTAVVDSACRVFGIDGLRVVDASIFPAITYANINAPTIMVAERAADLIRSGAVQ